MVGDGMNCLTTDPCSSNPCKSDQICRNGIGDGSFECHECPTGLVPEDGECITKRHPCEMKPCHPGVECHPTGNATFECDDCPKGMQGDGINCKGKLRQLSIFL